VIFLFYQREKYLLIVAFHSIKYPALLLFLVLITPKPKSGVIMEWLAAFLIILAFFAGRYFGNLFPTEKTRQRILSGPEATTLIRKAVEKSSNEIRNQLTGTWSCVTLSTPESLAQITKEGHTIQIPHSTIMEIGVNTVYVHFTIDRNNKTRMRITLN
jgi:hypothetical protein